jgi:hypothetical protein
VRVYVLFILVLFCDLNELDEAQRLLNATLVVTVCSLDNEFASGLISSVP